MQKDSLVLFARKPTRTSIKRVVKCHRAKICHISLLEKIKILWPRNQDVWQRNFVGHRHSCRFFPFFSSSPFLLRKIPNLIFQTWKMESNENNLVCRGTTVKMFWHRRFGRLIRLDRIIEKNNIEIDNWLFISVIDTSPNSSKTKNILFILKNKQTNQNQQKTFRLKKMSTVNRIVGRRDGFATVGGVERGKESGSAQQPFSARVVSIGDPRNAGKAQRETPGVGERERERRKKKREPSRPDIYPHREWEV